MESNMAPKYRHSVSVTLLDTFNTDPLLFQNRAFSFRSGWYLNTNFLSSSQAGWCSLGVCRVMNSFAITRVSGIRTMLCEQTTGQSENQALLGCWLYRNSTWNHKLLSAKFLYGLHSLLLFFHGLWPTNVYHFAVFCSFSQNPVLGLMSLPGKMCKALMGRVSA